MRRWISCLLVLVMVLGMLPFDATAYNRMNGYMAEREPSADTQTQTRTGGFLKNYSLTGNGAADMVTIALAQEGRDGAQFGYSEEWCANFVTDCAILCSQGAAVPKTGSSNGLRAMIKGAGGTVVTSNPQPGDICFVDWVGGSSICHVEIVYAVSGSAVYTIGGNTGGGSSLSTRKVAKHAPLSAKCIVEILRPNYQNAAPARAGLDINGYLDGADSISVSNYGTFDVWVNGSLAADDVNDYCAEWPVGSSYEIKDIQSSDMHHFLGFRQGSQSGTIQDGGTDLRLQYRTLDNIGEDFYAYVVSKNTGNCLYAQEDRNATCQPKLEDMHELWHFERQGDGTYKITSAWNGYSLDVQGYGTEAGTNLILMPYTGNTAQQWCFFEEDGWCTISAICTPCVIWEDSATTNAQMMADNGTNAQWFRIQKVEPSYPFDVNAKINGAEYPDTQGRATFDVWINGAMAADDVTDYAQMLPVGTTYELCDIRIGADYNYNGLSGGTMSGKIGTAPVWSVLDLSDPDISGVGPCTAEAELNGSRYQYYSDRVSWFEAKVFCESQGGHLVTVSGEAESELVNSLCDGNSVWMGASDAAEEGNWKWITDEPFDYTDWGTGEPNNAANDKEGGENYLMYYADAKWNDIYGTAVYGFICELEPGELDVQGYLDGEFCEDLSGYGTFDIYINGNRVADDVNDYLQNLPYGIGYEIRDIRPADGYSYNGLYSGKRTGSVNGTCSRVILNFSAVASETIGEPVKEVVWNEHRYAFFEEAVTWYTAKAFCEEMGGHLVTIMSSAEEAVVRSVCGADSVWIGGSDAEKEGAWKWITGEPFEYQNWRIETGEPNNIAANHEGCENYAVSDLSGWNDVHGCELLSFVCEFEPVASKKIADGLSGDLAWSLTEDGTLTFTGEGRIKNYEYKSEMPWYDYRDQIVHVVLQEGVTSIGDYAFYGMPRLASIEIPSTVTSIGDYAFKNAPKIDDVVLPEGLTALGNSAFYACTSLSSIEIPAALWTIKPYTFKNCTALTEVIFHEGNLMKISDGAFYNTALTELVLPNCLTILDIFSFKNCAKLISIKLGSGLTELREAVFYATAIPTIAIPEGVTQIGPYAFKNCVALETIRLPESLTSVGEASFYGCTALEGLELPDAVTKIGNYAFRKCEALQTVTFSESLQNIGESSFYGCESLYYLNIPNSVATIQGYAFKGCTGLGTVILPDSLKTIGESAFHTCMGLDEITIPGGVTKIGDYCFSGSTGIDAIHFEGDAPTIGTGAFSKLTANTWYPEGNTTWNSSNMLNYGGTITWHAR